MKVLCVEGTWVVRTKEEIDPQVTYSGWRSLQKLSWCFKTLRKYPVAKDKFLAFLKIFIRYFFYFNSVVDKRIENTFSWCQRGRLLRSKNGNVTSILRAPGFMLSNV